MWSRRVSESVMKPEVFMRALLLSLKQDDVMDIFAEKISEVIRGEMIPLHANIDKMKKELASASALTDLQATLGALRAEIKTKDAKILALEGKVSALESSMDDLEQYTRRNSVRLYGLPETEGEETTAATVNALNENLLLDPPLTTQEIDRLHRVGPRGDKPRPVLIKFATYRSRHRVYANRKALYSENSNVRLYLNEDLTRRRAQLLAKARSLKKEGKILGAWSADGRLFIKNKRGTIQPLHTMPDLNRAASDAPASPSSSSPDLSPD